MIIKGYSTRKKVFEKNTLSLSLSLNSAIGFCAENFSENLKSVLSEQYRLLSYKFLRIHCEVLC